VIDLLRVNPCGRDIGGDSLATELIIDRRLTHGATLYGRVYGGNMHMGVDRMWMRPVGFKNPVTGVDLGVASG
jgi:hypothetical protein